MKRIAILFSLLVLPLFAFPAVRIGVSIPIFTGPAGPPVYVPATPVPVGTWENVSLTGVIVAASGNSVSVRTSEGVVHNVFFTRQTIVQGRLAYGSTVTVQAQLANGSLFANTITVVGEAAAGPYPNNYQPADVPPPPANGAPYSNPVYIPYPAPYPYPYPTYVYPGYAWPEVYIYGRWGWGGGWGRGGWGHGGRGHRR